MQSSARSFADVLKLQAEEQPERVQYVFLDDRGGEVDRLTNAELFSRCRSLAAQLQAGQEPGARVLLLYPPGLDFVVAFYACMLAGVVPVPAYPPDPFQLERTLPRLQRIVGDAGPSVVLSTAAILEIAASPESGAPQLGGLPWRTTDADRGEHADRWRDRPSDGQSLAFLQYTSGSTAAPRGVCVTHDNLLCNSGLIAGRFEHTRESVMVSWLPPYHDMGLIGGILQPLYVGFPAILMSPISFLKHPVRWLEAITRYRGTTSGAPSFAYAYCARRVRAEDREGLDLRSWDIAYDGSEPVQASAIDRFVAAFSGCGFRREAFYPCYGMAESTLIVSGGAKKDEPRIRCVDRGALQQNRIRSARSDGDGSSKLVGCGTSFAGHRILVVDPETRRPREPGEVGEIWLSGPSLARGYWNLPDQTDQVFGARLEGGAPGGFLRTGDLGFLDESGELFVTGRSVELLTIHGLNHYAQDIELTVCESHPALRPGAAAAFMIDQDGEERLVVLQEVKERVVDVDLDEIERAVRRYVTRIHGVSIHDLVFARAGSMPKTTSGKTQRYMAKRLFLDGEVPPWRPGPANDPAPGGVHS